MVDKINETKVRYFEEINESKPLGGLRQYEERRHKLPILGIAKKRILLQTSQVFVKPTLETTYNLDEID